MGLKYAILSNLETSFESLIGNTVISLDFFNKINHEYCRFIFELINFYLTFLRSKKFGFLSGDVITYIEQMNSIIQKSQVLETIIKNDFEIFLDKFPNIKNICINKQKLNSKLKHEVIKELFSIPAQKSLIFRIIFKIARCLNRKWEKKFYFDTIKEFLTISKEKKDLILGQDTSEMYKLEKIKECIESLDYEGIILKKKELGI